MRRRRRRLRSEGRLGGILTGRGGDQPIASGARGRQANGDVEARITLPPGGFADIASANGNTDLFVPVNTSATFSALVGNGNIEIFNLELQDPVTTDRTVIGVLGEGDGAITLGTGNGRITATGF